MPAWRWFTQGPDRTLGDVREKLRLDLRYIQRSTPALEARILLQTLTRLRGR